MSLMHLEIQDNLNKYSAILALVYVFIIGIAVGIGVQVIYESKFSKRATVEEARVLYHFINEKHYSVENMDKLDKLLGMHDEINIFMPSKKDVSELFFDVYINSNKQE